MYANNKSDIPRLQRLIGCLKGVEQVLTRAEAAETYHLMGNRIGDIVVPGDEHTVFGNLDAEYEKLPDNYRTHGSEYEVTVPLYVFNAHLAPSPITFLPIIRSPPGFLDNRDQKIFWPKT